MFIREFLVRPKAKNVLFTAGLSLGFYGKCLTYTEKAIISSRLNSRLGYIVPVVSMGYISNRTLLH